MVTEPLSDNFVGAADGCSLENDAIDMLDDELLSDTDDAELLSDIDDDSFLGDSACVMWDEFLSDSEWRALFSLLDVFLSSCSSDVHTIPGFEALISLPLILEEAERQFGQTTEQAAEAAGRDCLRAGEGFDAGFISECEQMLSSVGFSATISHFQNHLSERTLQMSTVLTDYQSFPEFDRLREIAESANIIFPSDFIPNDLRGGVPRPKFIRVQSAMEVLTSRLVKKRQAIVVHESVLREALSKEGRVGHSSAYHWTWKPTNPLGRQICDHSGSDSVTMPVNCPSLKPLLRERFGKLEYPSLLTFISLYFAVKNTFPTQRILIFKLDVCDAFPRVRFSLDSIAWLAIKLLGGLVLLNLVGTFGYMGFPFIYGVVMRALSWSFAQYCLATFGVVMGAIYCDDLVAFVPEGHARNILSAAQSLHVKLLGTDAVRDEKTVFPTHVADVLGWMLDTDTELVLPSARALLRLFRLFFALIPVHPVSLTREELQRLQSLTLRYSAAIPFLRLFSHSFGPATRGLRFRSSKRSVGPRLYADIMMWRVGLLMLLRKPLPMAVPFQWLHLDANPRMCVSQADYVLFCDAATSSSCVGVFVQHVGFFQWFAPPSLVGSHSNRLEFVGAVLGVFVLALAISPSESTHVHVFTDNTNALYDASRSRARDPLASALLMSLSLLQVHHHIKISWEHVPGQKNEVADALSRDFRNIPLDVVTRVRHILEPLRQFQVPSWYHDLIVSASSTSSATPLPLLLKTLMAMVGNVGGNSCRRS
jgi:hypothetical protein